MEDGYLVNYSTLEYKSKIMESGIHYDELYQMRKKKSMRIHFSDDDTVGDDISGEGLQNTWLLTRIQLIRF